jgi:hypothetical protein
VTTVPDERVAADAPTRAKRAPVILYTLAFVLLLAGLGSMLLAVRGFLQELWPLWLSAGLSVAAILFALAGMITARRR